MSTKIIAMLVVMLLPAVFANSVRIYKNAGCGHCDMYMGELVPMLQKNGYNDITITDFISNTSARTEVEGIQERFGVPLSMQGHLLVLVDDKYLFEGHVPAALIEAYLKDPKGNIVVTQDKMENPASYMMLMDGKQHTCPIDQPLNQCALGSASDDGGATSLLVTWLPFGLLVVAAGFVFYSLRGK